MGVEVPDELGEETNLHHWRDYHHTPEENEAQRLEIQRQIQP
jgi:hypothetical protein